MPPSHLRLEEAGDFRRGGFAQLLCQDELPGEVQEEVTQLLADGLGVALAQGVIQLEELLDQVGAEGLPGLGAVPGTAAAKVPDHRHRTPKR